MKKTSNIYNQGESNPRAKLTQSQVELVRQNKTIQAKNWATKLNVSIHTIYKIWGKKRWQKRLA